MFFSAHDIGIMMSEVHHMEMLIGINEAVNRCLNANYPFMCFIGIMLNACTIM